MGPGFDRRNKTLSVQVERAICTDTNLISGTSEGRRVGFTYRLLALVSTRTSWSGAYLCPGLLALAGATKFVPVRVTRGGSNKYTSMYYPNPGFVGRTSFPSDVFILAGGVHGFWTRYQMPG